MDDVLFRQTSDPQISFCIRSSEVWHCRRPNSCLAAMSIMDCVIRQTFSVSATIVNADSGHRPSPGTLEHDTETPRPSTLADITAVVTQWNPQYDRNWTENITSILTSEIKSRSTWPSTTTVSPTNSWHNRNLLKINRSFYCRSASKTTISMFVTQFSKRP